MSRTSALRRQHDAASKLASQLLVDIENYRGEEDACVISLELAKLLGLLQIHLAQEDRSLYPSLIASGDERVAAVAHQFVAEMGEFAKGLHSFAKRWPCSRAVSSNFGAFRNETIAVLDALNERILRENEELYPLADTLSSTTPRSDASRIRSIQVARVK